jgi:hypothetical protein
MFLASGREAPPGSCRSRGGAWSIPLFWTDKMFKSLALSVAFAVGVVAPACAEDTEGLVLAYDRQDHIIVLADKTVWQLPSGIAVPADLGHGDRVMLEFESGGDDDGITAITAMHSLATATPEGTDGGS